MIRTELIVPGRAVTVWNHLGEESHMIKCVAEIGGMDLVTIFTAEVLPATRLG